MTRKVGHRTSAAPMSRFAPQPHDADDEPCESADAPGDGWAPATSAPFADVGRSCLDPFEPEHLFHEPAGPRPIPPDHRAESRTHALAVGPVHPDDLTLVAPLHVTDARCGLVG